MKNKTDYKKIVIAIAVINFIIRIPFLNLPAYRDEMVYLSAAKRVFENNLNPFIDFYAYKPPIIFFVTAILFTVFSPTRWIARLLIALFSSLGIYLTYALGREIFGKRAGITAALLLFLHPLFVAQSMLFQAEVPLLLMFVLVLYAYFSNKPMLYTLAASLFVSTKEVASIALISLIIFDVITQRKRYLLKNLVIREAFLSLPLLLILSWIMINKQLFGWFVWPKYLTDFAYVNHPDIKPSSIQFIQKSFVDQMLMIFYAVSFGVLSIASLKRAWRKKFIRKETLYFLSISIVIPILYYSFYFLPRYILFTYPLLLLAFSWFLVRLLGKHRLMFRAAVVALSLALVYININAVFPNKSSESWPEETNLSYLREVWLSQRVGNVISNRYPSQVVITTWPTEMYQWYLGNPFFGLADRSVRTAKFTDCQEMKDRTNYLVMTTLDQVYATEQGEDLRCINELDLEIVEIISLSGRYLGKNLPYPVILYTQKH